MSTQPNIIHTNIIMMPTHFPLIWRHRSIVCNSDNETNVIHTNLITTLISRKPNVLHPNLTTT